MLATQKSILEAYPHIETYSEWEADLRQKAIEHVETVGLPDRQLEAWKYSPLPLFYEQSFSLTSTPNLLADQMAALKLPDIPRLVCVDGIVQPQLSTMTNNEIFVCSLHHLIRHQPELLKRYLNQTTSPHTVGFNETNTALFKDGFFIHIPEYYKTDSILFLNLTTQSNTPSMHHIRNIIVSELSSHLTFLEYHLSTTETPCFSSCINELFLHKNTQCDWVQHQQLGSEHYHFSETRVEQQRDSTFKHHHRDQGGKFVRHDVQINLNEPGANCHLMGLYDLKEKQYVDNHTTIHHRAPDTQSVQHYKGIIDDKAHAVFNGRMVIHPNACRVHTEQNNHNLLLSKQAEVDTKPELEIYNDDVKATHGATIGQIDPEALFYLQSRGIDKANAFLALLDGFRQEIINLLPDQIWQAYVEEMFMKDTPHE